jgi:hypothetical protein
LGWLAAFARPKPSRLRRTQCDKKTHVPAQRSTASAIGSAKDSRCRHSVEKLPATIALANLLPRAILVECLHVPIQFCELNSVCHALIVAEILCAYTPILARNSGSLKLTIEKLRAELSLPQHSFRPLQVFFCIHSDRVCGRACHVDINPRFEQAQLL